MKGEICHILMLQQEVYHYALGIQFPLFQSATIINQGNFNINRVFEDRKGKKYIIRTENPQGRSEELPSVEAEYRGVGFLNNPLNKFKIRNSLEQFSFAKQLALAGISATKAIFTNEDSQIIYFEEGAVNISDLWLRSDDRAGNATRLTLEALTKVHKNGFALGDRWGPNELMNHDGQIIFVDFDIEILGPETKEFELASLLYFTSYFAQLAGNDSNVFLLLDIYKEFLQDLPSQNIYNMLILRKYIENYFEYFQREGKYRWRNPQEAERFKSGLLIKKE